MELCDGRIKASALGICRDGGTHNESDLAQAPSQHTIPGSHGMDDVKGARKDIRTYPS